MAPITLGKFLILENSIAVLLNSVMRHGDLFHWFSTQDGANVMEDPAYGGLSGSWKQINSY